MDLEALREEIRNSIEYGYSRSGGPGGQNVNKRDTKVTARLNIEQLEIPGPDGRDRLRRGLAERINADGEIVLQVETERSQLRNREEALERMTFLVLRALRPPPRPRRPTKPSRAARERRLAGKKLRSGIKKGRGRIRPGSGE